MDVGGVLRAYWRRPGLYPHLAWLGDDRPQIYVPADRGCQGLPWIGRVAFVELREQPIHRLVEARFAELAHCAADVPADGSQPFQPLADVPPVVHVISSVCGGTGAGMLLDMAYNLRWWSRESFGKSAEIVGRLVLPDASSEGPQSRVYCYQASKIILHYRLPQWGCSRSWRARPTAKPAT